MVYARLILIIILSFFANSALAGDFGRREQLDLQTCYPAPRPILDHLEDSWWHMLPYSHICPVVNENSKIVLNVLTFRQDLSGIDEKFYNETTKKSWGRPEEAVIFDKKFIRVGKINGIIPYDPPFHLEVMFTDWRDGYPWRIEFAYTERHRDGTPREPPPPLLWNATNGVYQ